MNQQQLNSLRQRRRKLQDKLKQLGNQAQSQLILHAFSTRHDQLVMKTKKELAAVEKELKAFLQKRNL
ncbi:MAG: hypothetical protein MI784_18120 [Cytophagales bacterium]|nr:hypothetical protein [Cytophagales bacterium]